MDTDKKLQAICKAAYERKAEDIIIMEMGKHSNICDFFVLLSAPSTVRVKAIADHLDESLEKVKEKIRHKEGYKDGMWVLLDFGGILVHIFHQDVRRYYDIENLWGDVPKKKYIHR